MHGPIVLLYSLLVLFFYDANIYSNEYGVLLFLYLVGYLVVNLMTPIRHVSDSGFPLSSHKNPAKFIKVKSKELT